MAMAPRQRWLALLEGRVPDRIPTDYWATDEFHQRFRADTGCAGDEALWDKLHIDRPCRVEPVCLRPHHPNDKLADIWGLRYPKADYGSRVYE